MVVFDDYHGKPLTKDMGPQRGAEKVSPLKVLLSINTIPSLSKENFLCDSDNEAKFVSLISKKLEQTGYHVRHTAGDEVTTLL